MQCTYDTSLCSYPHTAQYKCVVSARFFYDAEPHATARIVLQLNERLLFAPAAVV